MRSPSSFDVCEVVGEVQPTQQLVLRSALPWASPRFANGNAKGERSSASLSGRESVVFWDLSQQKLTGFSTERGEQSPCLQQARQE